MKESDADYFARRAAEEDEAALKSARPETAQVHRTLARKYAELAAYYRDRDGR